MTIVTAMEVLVLVICEETTRGQKCDSCQDGGFDDSSEDGNPERPQLCDC